MSDTVAIEPTDPKLIALKKKLEKLPEKPQKVAELVGEAYDLLAAAESEKAEAQTALEQTEEYAAVESAQTKIAHADAILRGLKDAISKKMTKDGITNLVTEKHKVGLRTTERFEVVDEGKLVTWLKSMKKYSDIFIVEPVLKKAKLNALIKQLREDRKLPNASECGVECEENTSISVGFIQQ